MLFYLETRAKGFTLVEILLVIAIIGILAAVLFAVINSQRERARVVAFKEQMRTLVSGVSSCIDSGGTVQSPGDNPDRRICSTGTKHGAYLLNSQMGNCNGSGSYTIAAVGNGVFGTCNLSGGIDCTAFCSFNGCAFGINCR